MSNIAKRHTMSIIGAGGLGCNIVQNFTNVPNDPDKPYFANTKLHIIDTSASNINNVVSSGITTSIINDASGAGKHRLKAFAGVSDQVNTLLNDHKPTDFNVIVTSLSGGMLAA